LLTDELLKTRKADHIRYLYTLGIEVQYSGEYLLPETTPGNVNEKAKPKKKPPTSPIISATEILVRVISTLDFDDLCHLACVSKTMRLLARYT
jgi:hypothetical protein